MSNIYRQRIGLSVLTDRDKYRKCPEIVDILLLRDNGKHDFKRYKANGTR